MKKSMIFVGIALMLVLSVPIVFMLWTGTGYTKVPYSLSGELPDSVTVLEEFSVASNIYLVKGRFESEQDILRICERFRLLPNQEDVQYLGRAKYWDDNSDIPWFPLENTSRRLAFLSENKDGTLKKDVASRYESVLWIDDQNKLLIIQLKLL